MFSYKTSNRQVYVACWCLSMAVISNAAFAQVTLTLHQEEYSGLVPIIYQPSGVISSVYSNICLEVCPTENPLIAFRLDGARTGTYCLAQSCRVNGTILYGRYTENGVILWVQFTRLNQGRRFQADFSCTEGFEPLINGTEVENNRLQWSVTSKDSEHGWFLVNFLNGRFRRWRGRVGCAKLPTRVTTTIPTTAPTRAPTASSTTPLITATTTSTTTLTTTPKTVSSRTTTHVTPLPGKQFSALSQSAVSTVPSYLNPSTPSMADLTSSEKDQVTFNPQLLYPTVAGVGVALLAVCLALFFVRRRRTKKKTSDESPTAKSTSLGPAAPSVRYDSRYSDVELNLSMSNPTYSLPQEHSTADEKQIGPTGNENSGNVLPNNDMYAVVGSPNDETSVLPNDDLYAVVRKPAHREEETAPIPRLDMTENDIYGT